MKNQDEGVDREATTPRVSFSFAIEQARAIDLARRLDELAIIKSRRPHAIDTAGSKRALAMAHEARLLADRFARWPALNRETVAIERELLHPELGALETEAEALAASVPKPPPNRGP